MRAFGGSWLWTGDPEAAPIASGAVVFDDDQRVVAVGSSSELRAKYPGAHFELHPAVLMPGLVNAHTHLELSGVRGAVAGGRGFVPWLDNLLRVRSSAPADPEAIDEAVSELLGFGVAAVGDVCNRLESVAALASVPIVACVFHELLGRQPEVAAATLAAAEAEREAYRDFPAHVRYTLAPHTPYTLHPELLRTLARRAADSGIRSSLHLAEHAAERSFLANGSGPFADFITRAGTPHDWPAPGLDPVRYADQLGLLGPHLLLVHLTDARPDELAIVAERGSPVVLCPRSNLHIELKLPPLLDIVKAGIKPGLGTDSLASNASLDPLAEARALQKRFPTVPPLSLLAMATSWGADALGVADRVGRLAPGLGPGLLAFEHTGPQPSDAARFVLEQERAVRRVLMRPGRRVS